MEYNGFFFAMIYIAIFFNLFLAFKGPNLLVVPRCNEYGKKNKCNVSQHDVYHRHIANDCSEILKLINIGPVA